MNEKNSIKNIKTQYQRYCNQLNENNFLDEDIVAIIDPNYKLIVEKLNLAQLVFFFS